MKNTIDEYINAQGKSPYEEWLSGLKDLKAKAKIMMRIDRMALGLFGDVEPIGEGLSELRIHYGPGYRVYYGKEGQRIYLLLGGGDKSTQSKDIKQAKECWKQHKGKKSS